jgi:hypothetical protein
LKEDTLQTIISGVQTVNWISGKGCQKGKEIAQGSIYTKKNIHGPLINEHFQIKPTPSFEGSRRVSDSNGSSGLFAHGSEVVRSCDTGAPSCCINTTAAEVPMGIVKKPDADKPAKKKNIRYDVLTDTAAAKVDGGRSLRFSIQPIGMKRSLRAIDPADLRFGRNGWTSSGEDKAASDSCLSRVDDAHVSLSPVSDPLHANRTDDDTDVMSMRWQSMLVCTFCKGTEEDSVGGRLLPIPQRLCYAHINCIRVSRGVEQTQDGEFTGVESAVDR